MPEVELDEAQEEAKKDVISTGHGEIDDAVQAIKLGAVDKTLSLEERTAISLAVG